MNGIGNKEIGIVLCTKEEAGMEHCLGIVTKLGIEKIADFIDEDAEDYLTSKRRVDPNWLPSIVCNNASPETKYFAAVFDNKEPKLLAKIVSKEALALIMFAIKVWNNETLTDENEIKLREAIRINNDEDAILQATERH